MLAIIYERIRKICIRCLYTPPNFGCFKSLVAEYDDYKSSVKSALEQNHNETVFRCRNLYLIIFERKHLEEKPDKVSEFKIQLLK